MLSPKLTSLYKEVASLVILSKISQVFSSASKQELVFHPMVPRPSVAQSSIASSRQHFEQTHNSHPPCHTFHSAFDMWRTCCVPCGSCSSVQNKVAFPRSHSHLVPFLCGIQLQTSHIFLPDASFLTEPLGFSVLAAGPGQGCPP